MILNRIKKIILTILGAIILAVFFSTQTFAEDFHGMSMSPLNQAIALVPGEEFSGSFMIKNAYGNTQDFKYIVEVKPFYVNDNYDIYYENTGEYNQLVDWITINTKGDTLPVDGEQKINFTINVPNDAPAGGQYAAIVVSSISDGENDTDGIGVTLNQNIAMAHILYAEIAGTTKHQGDIIEASVPSFILSGNISGISAVKNTGNIHDTAIYKLQVFPLFSDEELFTNEENPDSMVILPNRTYYNETTWENTPSIGIFNVIYTVDFEGTTTQVSKMVIKCPVWLLFIIIFAIIALIIWLITRTNSRRKNKSHRTPDTMAEKQ